MPHPPIAAPIVTRLADYRPPAYLVDRVTLDVQIGDPETTVTNTMQLRRNPAADKNAAQTLFLNGEAQTLLAVRVDGQHLDTSDYHLDEGGLTLRGLGRAAVVTITSRHNPYANTALSGFYRSGPMLTTQCEAEGFRRITFYPDRPDVLARFHVRMEADVATYPVLLSNGNLIKHGKLKGGARHFVEWEDPFPKPCYLFAMVAGNLVKVVDHFTTKTRRRILLEIYVEPGQENKTAIALRALKSAMKWDEDRYNLAYDLDRFMIVATPYFNMGAMENKGLNIFNSACVLARPDTATDADISFVERVVGHEYFHNWTGNRITCRDWFQLSLKEGLTVFREQQYMQTMNAAALERVREVRHLRAQQFAEDAGPNAHPVQPTSYVTIDNFYTNTIYDKGAELCRMLYVMLGEDGFQRGMALYVKRHDGTAATCADFVAAMADANRVDLGQFMLWYSQAGTPVLNVTSAYNQAKKRYTLTIQQSCPPTPGQKQKHLLHIPLALGLVGKDGRDLIGTEIVQLRRAVEKFTFDKIDAPPVPSLLRGFSAPVRVKYAYRETDLLHLLAHDHDLVNRWDAAQKLAHDVLLRAIRALRAGRKPAVPQRYLAALGAVLADPKIEPALAAMLLSLPSESELALAVMDAKGTIDPAAIHRARQWLRLLLAKTHRPLWWERWRALSPDPQATDGVTMGQRSLKNLCLGMVALVDPAAWRIAFDQLRQSPNMTDQVAALSILMTGASPKLDAALKYFYGRWRHAPMILDKWFAVQTGAARRDALKRLRGLLRHPDYERGNPNRLRATVGAFAHGNLAAFHAPSGAGYRLIAAEIKRVDRLNPQMAARLVQAFDQWRDLEPKRRRLAHAALTSLQATRALSRNSRELVDKMLS